MKIIGTDTKNNKLIIEMSENEFAHFAGFGCEGSASSAQRGDQRSKIFAGGINKVHQLL